MCQLEELPEDIKFIRRFRIMLVVLGYSRNYISSVLGFNRKYISLVLNERINHKDLSKKRYKMILMSMLKFYEENEQEMRYKLGVFPNESITEKLRII
ncbi:MAG: hypothetical protein ACOCP8_01660 [archaeon]